MDSVADSAEGPATGWCLTLTSQTYWSKSAVAKLHDAYIGITTMGQALYCLGA